MAAGEEMLESAAIKWMVPACGGRGTSKETSHWLGLVCLVVEVLCSGNI